MFKFLKTKTKVVLDTNFLIIPGELGVDIFWEISRIMNEPYEICVLDKSLEELQKIIMKSGKKKEGLNAKLGFIMAKQKGLKTISSSSQHYTDDALVELAKKNPKGIVVATQDKELKNKIMGTKARIIELQQKKRLVIR